MSDGITDDVSAVTPESPSAAAATPSAVVHRRRPNRFERPAPPHDWRWVVGGIGKTLITVGLLMFAFVAYQLWGTGIQTAQAQNRLEDRFAEVLATTAAPVTATTVTGSTVTATTLPSTVVPSSTPPAQAGVEPGDPVAQLQIPSIDVDLIVVEGVGRDDLQQGPGHFPETPMPGQLGNAAIAGHRTTFGAPFYDLDELEPGDEIVTTTTSGRYVYVVTGQRIVGPGDYAEVIPTVDAAKATLVLTTCHPIRSAAKRLVVTAELDPARSSAVTPLPRQVPDGIPTTQPPASTIAPTPATTATTGNDQGVIPGDDEPAPPSHDAFGDGWFSDPAAWPHVIAWGLALLAVTIGAHALMRRTKRYWPGLLAGSVPFVVLLYFWFENVNRLLPPNL